MTARALRARIAAVGAVLALLLAACGGGHPSGSGSPASPAPGATPTLSATEVPTSVPVSVTQMLAAVTQGLSQTIVPVPGGYEAAAYDQNGNLGFWAYHGSWAQVGGSAAPVIPESPGMNIEGALLDGMQDATFVAEGQFTGDATGDAEGFASGPGGWGVLAPGPGDTLVPTGEADPFGATPITAAALWLRLGFDGGELVSAQENPYFLQIDHAAGPAYGLLTHWRWNGTLFDVDTDSSFKAEPASVPPRGIPFVTSCPDTPPDGTYEAYLQGGVAASGTYDLAAGMVQVLFGPSRGAPAPSSSCSATVDQNLPMTIEAAGTSGAPRWVTAPAWLLELGEVPPVRIPFRGGASEGGLPSPYQVPASLHLTRILSDLGMPSGAVAPTPVLGEVTIVGGEVTALAILQA